MHRYLYLLVLVLLCPSAALAQPLAPDDPVKTTAEAHLRRGTELLRQKAYAAALIELERSYALLADARVLYRIGQAKLALRDYLGAATSFDRYIAATPAVRAPEHPQAAPERAEGPTARVSITLTVHEVALGTTTLQRLAQLTVADERRLVELLLAGLAREAPSGPAEATAAASPARTAAPPEVGSATSVAAPAPPEAVATVEPSPPRRRVARGIDMADPYAAPR